MIQVQSTHRALDGQVFAAIDCRTYGDKVFVPRLCAQGLEGHTSERIDELVRREFVPEIFGAWALRLSENYGKPYPSIAIKSGLNNSSAEHSHVGYETLGAKSWLSMRGQ